ncbi:hypothetical protein [Streptomyces sp. NPDC001292]|uniref:hypothetical protein n=1 Tax=Streptomyces sp. NPDC001292 TaxID=3364558 RepID=UPI00367B942F
MKSTILDGRVLCSRSVRGLEQEISALLTAYQALIRTAGDITIATPGLSAQRVNFTVPFQATADQIITARQSTADAVSLIGTIGRAVLDHLLPEGHRQRLKTRFRKTASKYDFERGDIPAPSRRTRSRLRGSRTGALTTEAAVKRNGVALGGTPSADTAQELDKAVRDVRGYEYAVINDHALFPSKHLPGHLRRCAASRAAGSAIRRTRTPAIL